MAKKPVQTNGLAHLKQALKNKSLDRLYVFYGEEVFLLKHYLTQMRKLLLDPLTESFNYHRFNNENFHLQAFGDAVEGMPMMAEYTFVQVDEVDFFKFNEADRNQMAAFLGDVPEWCTVVFTYETVEWKPDKRNKKFWDIVEKTGTIVPLQAKTIVPVFIFLCLSRLY